MAKRLPKVQPDAPPAPATYVGAARSRPKDTRGSMVRSTKRGTLVRLTVWIEPDVAEWLDETSDRMRTQKGKLVQDAIEAWKDANRRR